MSPTSTSSPPDPDTRHTGASWTRASLAGLGFGATSSVLNHLPGAGLLAAAIGSGAGWLVFGVACAVVLAVRHPTTRWSMRAAVAAVTYALACTSYYVADWLFSVPGLLRLQADVRAGVVPDPGGVSLVPDLEEWLFWTAASVPAALVSTGVAWLVLRQLRETR